MEAAGKRTSDRIEIEIPIEVAGTDCLGVQFFDRARTLVIGRHGGKIALARKLVPQQEITVRCLATGLEADARVVGQIEKSGESYNYGIKFLDEKDHIWGIEFPPLTDSEGAMGRVMLECIGCKHGEVIHLDDFELEVLEANGYLSRSCTHCRDVSTWRRSRGEMPGPEVAASPAPPPPSPRPSPPHDPPPTSTQPQERRCEPRRILRVTACVRTARIGEDLVKTRNVSRRGLCFISPCVYVLGEEVEVAVPYSPEGGNIFLPAKIARLQYLASEGTWVYGIVYRHWDG